DLDLCKQHLVSENNKGNLNIDKLCVIAAKEGGAVAMNWAARDWNRRAFLGIGKQGPDVKGLVLLSPTYNVKGFNVTKPLQFPPIQKQIAFQIIVGKRSSARNKHVTDANRIHDMLSRWHPKPKTVEDARKFQMLWLETYTTTLQGTDLLASERPLRFNNRLLADRMLGFINLRMADKDYDWQYRKSPFNNDK
ncbi:MAG: hypothetical protein N2C14_23265, partial [Planctomycetales bacterium]